MKPGLIGTKRFRPASRRRTSRLIEVTLRYVWRGKEKPPGWFDERTRRSRVKPLSWRAAAAILMIKYNLGLSYRGMERFLHRRPALLRRLRIRKAPNRVTLNNAYLRMDRTWFVELSGRIAARVEWEEARSRRGPRPGRNRQR